MNRNQQDRLFRRGLAICRKGRLSEAAVVFRRLVDGGSEEPLHLSYSGLLTATVGGRRPEGLELCERALEFGAYEPEVIVNLARLYESLGSRQNAIKLLRRGLRESPHHHPAMMSQIERLSPRRQPPLSMIDRDHLLNKHLAILLARLSGQLDRNTDPGRNLPARGKAAARL